MSKERILWQNVLLRALLDASRPDSSSDTDMRARHDAKAWFSKRGKDFRQVCDLAGIDPDFVLNAYDAGKLTWETLKQAEAS